LQWRIVHSSHGAKQRIGEIASDHSADLCYLAHRPKSVEPRHQGLLERRRDGLDVALLAALQQEPGYLLDEQRHPAGALSHAINDFLG
jgi:hypothetical protein